MLGLKSMTRHWIAKGLFDHGIMTIAQLCAKTEAEIRQINIINGKNMACLKDALDGYGLRFGMSAEELAAYKKEYWREWRRNYMRMKSQLKQAKA